MELRFGGKGSVVLSDGVNELLNKKIERYSRLKVRDFLLKTDLVSLNFWRGTVG